MIEFTSHDFLIIIFSAGAIVCTVNWLKQAVNKISEKLTIIPIEMAEVKSSINEIRRSIVKVEISVEKCQQDITELNKQSISNENDLHWIKDKINKNI